MTQAAQFDQSLLARSVETARSVSTDRGITILEALIEVMGCSDDVLAQAVAELLGYRYADSAFLAEIEPRFSVVPFAQCLDRRLIVASHATSGDFLIVSDPFDCTSEDWALRRCAFKGVHVSVALANPSAIADFFTRCESQLRALDGLPNEEANSGIDEAVAVISLSSIASETSQVVRLVDSTIYDALKARASDIHLECDSLGMRILYRIDGVMIPISQVQGRETAEQVVSRVKVLAELDIAERRIPQDGRFKVRVSGRDIDFRVSIMPGLHGEDAVLRLLDRQALTDESRTLRLDHLGLDGASMHSIRRLAMKPHGMLLVTGPTGSGKTTTLYAAITEIHTGRDKIVTIEDPVEYRLPSVLQIPVNEKKGLTFARGLRSILRHDPDKIMVGEIRDDETAQIAVQAALTGHLVFTTVHANNVFDVVGRFLHMGVDAYSLSAALNGVVSQRLIRINCLHCIRDVEPDPAFVEELSLSAGALAGMRCRAGAGCERCANTGYLGRKAVAETLTLEDELRDLIASRAPVSAVRARAVQLGLRPILSSAIALAAAGETTLSEVVRVAG